MQIHKQSRQRNNMKVLKNTLSELQRPVIKPIATLQPVTNTEFWVMHEYYNVTFTAFGS